MGGPPAPVAEVRRAVRAALTGDHRPPAGDLVLVACSGGADSLALLTATLFEAPRAGLRAGSVTVDHGWSPDSAGRAEAVRATAAGLGAVPAEVVRAPCDRTEDAARRARYASLQAVAERCGASRVLLGHSLDDQAETVLLGLARGSGARSLAGMPAVRGPFQRPLLAVRRTTLRAAVAAAGLSPWDDPANCDPAFTRSRVRHTVLPVAEAALGPGVAEALARTAQLLRADGEALDEIAAGHDPGGCAVDVDDLHGLPTAVRSRVLRLMLHRAGAPPGALTAAHIAAVDALVTAWHGQGPVMLPSGLRAVRRCGRLTVGRDQDHPAPCDEETGD